MDREGELLDRANPELFAAINELMRVSASLRPHDAEAMESAFNTLAALIEGSPEPARGYLALSLLMALPHSIGNVEGRSETTWEYTKGRGHAGGNESAIARRNKRNEWTEQALIVAKDYIARHPAYGNAGLARHVKKLSDLAPGKRAIETVIAKWQSSGLIPLPGKL